MSAFQGEPCPEPCPHCDGLGWHLHWCPEWPQPLSYRALLVKYLRHVRSCEGISYIDDTGAHSDVRFPPEEWAELQRLDEEARRP